jgi:hypothetical protein
MATCKDCDTLCNLTSKIPNDKDRQIIDTKIEDPFYYGNDDIVTRIAKNILYKKGYRLERYKIKTE